MARGVVLWCVDQECQKGFAKQWTCAERPSTRLDSRKTSKAACAGFSARAPPGAWPSPRR